MKLTIKTDNSAFDDDKGYEIARILRKLADKIESGETRGVLRDYNGNRVSSWEL